MKTSARKDKIINKVLLQTADGNLSSLIDAIAPFYSRTSLSYLQLKLLVSYNCPVVCWRRSPITSVRYPESNFKFSEITAPTWKCPYGSSISNGQYY